MAENKQSKTQKSFIRRGFMQTLRDNNMIYLVCTGKREKDLSKTVSSPGSKVFKAYTNGEIDFDFSIKTGISGDLAEKLGTVGRIASNAAVLQGIVPQVDFARWADYQGTDPLRFTVTCHLVVIESYEKDIKEPLEILFSFALPTRRDPKEDFWGKAIADTYANLISGARTLSTKKDVGEVFFLNMPDPVDPSSDGRMFFYSGNTIIDDVYITSLKIARGPIVLANKHPERVDLTIGFSTLRVVTTNMISSFYQ